MDRREEEKGFSLIEVLAAVALLGLAFVTIFEVFGRGLSHVGKAEVTTQALLHARSVMDEVTAGILTEPVTDSGSSDGYDYHARVTKIESEEESTAELYEVTVRVSWPGGGGVEISSLKTENVPEEQ